MTGFGAVHGRLREIVPRHRGDLAVTKDDNQDWGRIQRLVGRSTD
jgi:hypothetical protein